MYEVHLTPLAVIQGVLPLFRISSSRQGLGKSKGSTTRASVIALVPATSSRVGVAFSGANAMAIAGFVKGLEVLRRELDDTDVIIVDVGSIDIPGGPTALELHRGVADSEGSQEFDVIALTKAWTASERRAYGSAYEAALIYSSAASASNTKRHKQALPRRHPTDIDTLLASIIPLVHVHRYSRSRWHPFYVLTHLSKTWRRMSLYFRGYRISVGAGSGTYTAASLLPYWLLDAILALPATLVSWKNMLVPPSTLRSRSPSNQDEAPMKPAPGQRENRGKKPMGLIEDKVASTAPASTASNDSRRESIGSFEGVAINLDSGDEVGHSRKGSSVNGSHTSDPSHPVLPEDSVAHSSDSLSASVLADSHVRTPSVGSGQSASRLGPRQAADRPERMVDSWVSLSESTAH